MVNGITIIFKPERKDDDGYIRCECGEKTVLVTLRHWEADEEPYKSGETCDCGFGNDDIELEVSGHYCPKCLMLVSLTYNF